jgi:hypothetical protein
VIAFLVQRKIAIPDVEYLKILLLFSLLVPFLLPRMHERYFFIAECLAIVYVFYYRKHWWIPVLLQVVAINTYYQYLYGLYLFPLSLSFIGMFILTVWLCWFVFQELRSKNSPAIPNIE